MYQLICSFFSFLPLLLCVPIPIDWWPSNARMTHPPYFLPARPTTTCLDLPMLMTTDCPTPLMMYPPHTRTEDGQKLKSSDSSSAGLSKGVGFVRFDQRIEAERAIKHLHNTIPEGATEPITVKFANNPSNNAKALAPLAAYLSPQRRFAGPIHHPANRFRYIPISPISRYEGNVQPSAAAAAAVLSNSRATGWDDSSLASSPPTACSSDEDPSEKDVMPRLLQMDSCYKSPFAIHSEITIPLLGPARLRRFSPILLILLFIFFTIPYYFLQDWRTSSLYVRWRHLFIPLKVEERKRFIRSFNSAFLPILFPLLVLIHPSSRRSLARSFIHPFIHWLLSLSSYERLH